MLRDRLGVSERRACLIAGQHRSTQRRDSCVAADDAALRAALRKLSRERPRWGYRRAPARQLEQGWSLNRKRTQRLWREEGLRVPPAAHLLRQVLPRDPGLEHEQDPRQDPTVGNPPAPREVSRRPCSLSSAISPAAAVVTM